MVPSPTTLRIHIRGQVCDDTVKGRGESLLISYKKRLAEQFQSTVTTTENSNTSLYLCESKLLVQVIDVSDSRRTEEIVV